MARVYDLEQRRAWERNRPPRDRREYNKAYEKKRNRPSRSKYPTPKPLAKECGSGHPYTQENTYVRPDGERECRTCKRINRRQTDMTRRAKLAGAFVETVSAKVVFERDEGVCGICHEPVDPLDYHVDHIVAISVGGLHSYANSQVAHPLCNLRKGVR